MESKYVDMSFTVANKEILSVSGITFENSSFPYVYEDIEKISILIDDDFELTHIVALNISMMIDNDLETFRFNISHNDLSSLFDYVDISVLPMVIRFNDRFQLKNIERIPKDMYGFYKNNTNKPLKILYDELGIIKSLHYLDVDPNSSDMYYYNASCHTTPKCIAFDEFSEIDIENSYFSIHRKNTTFIIANYQDHINLIYNITKKRAYFNIQENIIRFENTYLSADELLLLRFYYSFNYYKLKFNLDYQSRDELFELDDAQKMLISMLLY
jgi:hypothetical protein